MTSWEALAVSSCGRYHTSNGGKPAYAARYDRVLNFHSPGLAPVTKAGESWHITIEGEAAYPQRYIQTFGFYDVRAAVQAQDGWHHIHVDGKPAYKQRYAWCGNFQEGICTVRDSGGAYLHIKKCGTALYRRRWTYAGDFRDGIAVVQAKNGYSTHIDTAGQYLHGNWFIDLDVYHKGFARARDEAGCMHIDQMGRPAYQRRFASIEPFYNGQARVETDDGAIHLIDETGETIREARAALRSTFDELSADMVGFWRTQLIAAAVRLRVIDYLPADASSLAKRCEASPERVARFLAALSEMNLLVEREGIWQATDKGRYLYANHPLSLSGAALEYADHFINAWAKLPAAIVNDTSWTPPSVFAQVSAAADRVERHHHMLRSYARHDYSEMPELMVLNGDEQVVDAAGGLGALADLIKDSYPKTEIRVIEREEVVRLARRKSSGTEEITWIEGDILEPWPVSADVIILARILHDWDDEGAERILRNAAGSLNDHGRLFVIEMLLPEESNAGATCDMHLLAVTGGQDRKLSHYRALMRNAGFDITAVRRGTKLPQLIEARLAQ